MNSTANGADNVFLMSGTLQQILVRGIRTRDDMNCMKDRRRCFTHANTVVGKPAGSTL